MPLRPLLQCLALALAGASALAEDLLQGTIGLADGQQLAFTLSGESRENVIGGTLRLGEQSFTIDRMSRLGLIGARRSGAGEFAVFSSSFSEQTARGQPWVAGKRYLNCDQPYNSFLAVYRVEGTAALEKLGSTPYPALTEDGSKSTDSTVYCFMSRPPA
jgi:hypothetical protein